MAFNSAANQRIAANVRAEMARRDISQEQLGVKIGQTQHFISRRLTSKVHFTIPELADIAAALDVPLADLVDADDNTEAAS